MADLLTRLQSALGGRYRIERELGRGGMATVILAHDTQHDRPVAIKVLRPELASSLGPERFEREIRLAARLNHPNILPLFDSGSADGMLYYVMPYVSGQSLAARLSREVQLPIPDAVDIARQVAAALAHAHEAGFVHRDIKPDNILLDGERALVADFGIARALAGDDTQKLTETGLSIGTPTYMSPEQFADSSRLDGRTDIYSLGCVLYHMLIGEPPFSGPSAQAVLVRHSIERVPNMRAVRDTIPASLELVVNRAMAKTPADRFQTATQFSDALGSLSHDTVPVTIPARKRRVSRKTWLLVALGAVLVVAIQAVLALKPWKRGAEPRALDPNAVLVLPVRVAGPPDSILQAIAAQLPAMLSPLFPGDGGPRAVDQGTTDSVLSTMTPPQGELTIAGIREAARAMGAGMVLRAQVAPAGARVVLDASLQRMPDAVVLARVEHLEGPRDSLVLLVNRLAAELLARSSGEPSERLNGLIRTRLPALRAYLAGQSAFASGRFTTAVGYFRQALAVDSGFALAALGLATAGPFVHDTLRTLGLGLAWSARERLGPSDRTYLSAMAGPKYPRPSSAAEEVRAWELAVEVAPDRMERWYQLGERFFHAGPWLGLPNTRDRAAAAFRKVLDLDSVFVPALGHLLDLAGSGGDTAQVRALGAQYLALDSVGDLAEYYRWRVALALRDSLNLEQVRGRMSHLTPATLERIVNVSQLDGVAPEDGWAAATSLRQESSSTFDARYYDIKLREIALNRGRPGEAAQLTRNQTESTSLSAQARDRLIAVIESLYWGADSTLAGESARKSIAASDLPFAPGEPALGARYLDDCAAGLWQAGRGDFDRVPRIIARLRAVPDAMDNFQSGYIPLCADILDTQLAFGLNRGDATGKLVKLDSLMRTGPPAISWVLAAGNLTVARYRERQGDLPAALAATRRRTYVTDLGERRVLVCLSTLLREEGRLAALTGDRAGAVRAYTHYLALRSGAEAAIQPEVNQVRAELARLRQ